MRKNIKIGDKVWVVDNNYSIEEKTILEISDVLKTVDDKKQTIKKYLFLTLLKNFHKVVFKLVVFIYKKGIKEI